MAEGFGATQLGDHANPREYLRGSRSIRSTLTTMNRLGVRQMAVVEDEDPSRLAGILSMSDVMRAILNAEQGADSARARSVPSTVTPFPL
jgi:predicted transcriptional regulator